MIARGCVDGRCNKLHVTGGDGLTGHLLCGRPGEVFYRSTEAWSDGPFVYFAKCREHAFEKRQVGLTDPSFVEVTREEFLVATVTDL